jgi:hypothetical protein
MKNEIIEVNYNSLIYEIRGHKVMQDSDLATRKAPDRNSRGSPGGLFSHRLRSEILAASWNLLKSL